MQHQSKPETIRLLRFRQVRERVALSRSTITRLERRGEFPHHIRLTSGTVAWREDAVEQWLRERIAFQGGR
jgi:prophage regulatory protein